MRVKMMPQPTSLDVVPGSAGEVSGRQRWVTVAKPDDLLEMLAPFDEVLKTLNFDPSPGMPARLSEQYALAGGVLGLTTCGFALARGLRDRDELGIGLAATTAALIGLGFMEHALAHVHLGLPTALRVARDTVQAIQDNRMATMSEATRPVVPFGIWSSPRPARGGG